ncbi:MAG: hypothetical protein HKM93_19505 [Desulfobacteraceae bacterium]|nr:hypothetical protein [Desulfobacteraceae bacterium]
MTIANNRIVHLVHSSNLIKIQNRVIIFDFPKAEDDRSPGFGLHDGCIDPVELADENIYVVISHRHGDHLSKPGDKPVQHRGIP